LEFLNPEEISRHSTCHVQTVLWPNKDLDEVPQNCIGPASFLKSGLFCSQPAFLACDLLFSKPMVISDPERFKVNDASSYTSVASDFDRFTRRFTTPIARQITTLARLKPGATVLDIGTGTGIVALTAAPQVLPNGRVIGIDLSPGMIAVARRHAAAYPDTLEFREMDAEHLIFADSSVDSVVSLFALLHFPNPLQAVREMYRVLRKGGSLVLAVGSRPPLSPMGIAHRIGRMPFLADKFLGRVLVAPSFLDELVLRHIPGGFAPETVEEFWDIQYTYSSIARKRLASANASQRKSVESAFASKCESVLAQGGRLVYTYAALYVVARRTA
jgi:ubiquinone/menaquinone biosynthesis C-methylase UbiE